MYIQVDEDFPQHPKSVRLCTILGNVVGWAFMIRLWCWASKYQHDGELGGFEPAEIESAAGWQKADGRFYAAAARVGFIDEDEPGKPGRLHDWMQRTGADIARMKAEAERSRTRKKAWRERQRNAEGTRDIGGTDPGYGWDGTPEERGGNAADKTSQDEARQVQARSGSDALPSRGSGSAHTQTPAQSNGGAKVWSTSDWLKKFGAAWIAQYNQLSYGQPGDSKACASLGDVLGAMPEVERIAAQEIAPAMFAEFLGRVDPRTVERRHPFAFFVQEWGGLRVPKKLAVVPGATKPWLAAEKTEEQKRAHARMEGRRALAEIEAAERATAGGSQ